MNLQDKIDASIALIRKGERLALAINPDDGYFVGFSGGKDSQVLLELVKMADVKYKAYYSVTTNDPPDNVYFIRNHYPDVTFLHPKKNFFRLIENKGLPTIFHRYCCAYLKENTGAGNVVLTGVRAEESAKRAAYNDVMVMSNRKEHTDRTKRHSIESIEENEHRCIKGKDKIMVFPILKWEESDVWEFIAQRELPKNPCYELGGRVGCMFCPFAKKEEIEYWEARYPRFKDHFVASLQRFLDTHRSGRTDVSGLKTAEEFYDWWKSRKTMNKYLADKRQIKMEFYQ